MIVLSKSGRKLPRGKSELNRITDDRKIDKGWKKIGVGWK